MGVSRSYSCFHQTTLLLAINVLMVLWTISTGAFFTPNAYTLIGVTPINGSNADGECPSGCVREPDTIPVRRCDCVGTTSERQITGVLIDNIVPTLDLLERDPVNSDIVWASQLFTVMGSTPNVTIGFRFQNSIMLREVELFLFHCPTWGIGAESIYVHTAGSFPEFNVRISSLANRGSVTLTSDMQNCTSLIRVSIPLQVAIALPNEFYNPSLTPIQWIHIAEVRFSDQPIPITMAPSTTPTTEETTIEVSSSTELPGVDITSPSQVSPTPTSPSLTSHQTEPLTTRNPTTSSTTSTAMTASNTTIILVVAVVVLLLLLAIGSVVFTAVVCIIKKKSAREDADRATQVSEMIETRRNEAYGQVSRKGGGKEDTKGRQSVEMMRNEDSAMMEKEGEEVEYEEIN